MRRVPYFRSMASPRNHVRTKGQRKMSVRAYVLLDIVDGSYEYALQMLRNKAGVVLADWLEGRPDIIAMIEAPNRQRLAEAIMPVLRCIDGITEYLHLLVTRDNRISPDLSTSGNSKPRKRNRKIVNTTRETTNSERR